MATLKSLFLNMSTLDKLKKNYNDKTNGSFIHSNFNQKEFVQTTVPALNVALSGQLDGGLSTGLTVFAAPSKHFKTAFAMLLSKSYLDKYDDGVVLFYDSEFGVLKDTLIVSALTLIALFTHLSLT